MALAEHPNTADALVEWKESIVVNDPSEPEEQCGEDGPELLPPLPDDVACSYVGRVQVTLRELKQEGFESLVLVEGDATTLEFLGKLFLAVAADVDCGWSMAPSGPGSVYFGEASEYGLYIHRLPCVNEQVKGGTRHGDGGPPAAE